MDNSRTNFISFGQTGYYNYISSDLLNRLSLAYPKSITTCYSENDLPQYLVDYAKSPENSGGFGNFRWKPYIIHKHLKTMRMGDILLYIDGRSHLKSIKKIGWLDIFVTSNYDFALSNEFKEYMFTSENVLEHFKVNGNPDITDTPQYLATYILMRKTSSVVKIINKWNYLATFNKELFEDNIDIDLNNEKFVYNKSDQAVLSVILKTVLNVNILDVPRESFFKSDTILLHYKTHHNQHPYLYFHLKRLLPDYIFNLIYKIYMYFR